MRLSPQAAAQEDGLGSLPIVVAAKMEQSERVKRALLQANPVALHGKTLHQIVLDGWGAYAVEQLATLTPEVHAARRTETVLSIFFIQSKFLID